MDEHFVNHLDRDRAGDRRRAGAGSGSQTLHAVTRTTPFIWSQTRGMLRLPVKRSGIAFAVSDVRADGTRIAAGVADGAKAVIWVVRGSQ